MSRYLVTGATGFLGGHLVELLLAAGHSVVALCRRPAPSLLARGVVVQEGDVLNRDSVKTAAAGCDGVFHCAGKVSWKLEDSGELYRIHVEGTKVVLDACRDAGSKRAVVASTSGTVAVSKKAELLMETSPTPNDIISRWPYYRSKLYAERAAIERNVAGFEVVSVNPSLLLGPGDIHGSSTSDVVSFLERKIPFIPAGGLSFVDARDAAQAMVLAMDKGRAGERYLVGAVNMTFDAFFGRLSRISGVAGPKIHVPKGAPLARAGAELMSWASERIPINNAITPVVAEMTQHFWYLDAAKAKRELGWTHRDAGDTLADTVEDITSRGIVWPT